MTIEMGAFGADVTSPFVPVGVTPNYPPPRAHIGPDKRRLVDRSGCVPIVLAHKWMFGFSLLASFIGLAVQVQIPNEVGQAIDALGKTTGQSLEYFVTIIVVLAAIRFVLTYLSRNYLLKTAYRIEYDLRNIMYEHLSRMSFSFYDRVQSGQLISRANSDIRSVQMFLAFAPIDPRAVQRRRPRLRGDAVDQRAARARRDVDAAVRATSSACACGSRCSRCRGSSRRAWPTSPPSSTRTSTASAW